MATRAPLFLSLPFDAIAFPPRCIECGETPSVSTTLHAYRGDRNVYAVEAPICTACLRRTRLKRLAWNLIVNFGGAVIAPCLLVHTLVQSGHDSWGGVAIVAGVLFYSWWVYFDHAELGFYSRFFCATWIERYETGRTIVMAFRDPTIARDVAKLAGIDVPIEAQTAASYRAADPAEPAVWSAAAPPARRAWVAWAAGPALVVAGGLVLQATTVVPDVRLLYLGAFWLVAGGAIMFTKLRERYRRR
jgi:hypothetical protein